MSFRILSDSNFDFPHPYLADKDGFLAIGGDLLPARLIAAYTFGIFPWYNDNTPILWFSTAPRMVLYPDKLKIAKSMRPLLNRKHYKVTIDTRFQEVIKACSVKQRKGQDGTWITNQMIESYTKLHELGYAHSVEVWNGDEMVGGLYGISLGKIFYGESMFALESNASKFGFITLVEILKKKGFVCIDCQQDTEHLRSFGSELISKEKFMEHLRANFFNDNQTYKWTDWINEQE